MKLLPALTAPVLFATATAGETCSSSDEMRFWNGAAIIKTRSMIKSKSLDNKEACMDFCLGDSQCVTFVYDEKKKCFLFTEPTSSELSSSAYTAKMTTGVRCDQSFEPRQADGKYPASVEKCTIENGGCDSSAVCTSPTKAEDDVVCSCATGEQFASDGETCTSTADAEKYCPTSTCWTYEMVKGTNKCVMKTGSAAKDAGCKMYLHCTPSIMDFRWNSEDLLGSNTVHNNAHTDCAIKDSNGKVGDTTPTGVDKMWQHAPASCDSTVTREVVKGEDMIVITKSFVYQGDTTGKNVGSMIYLDDAATVTIDVSCKFKATQSAASDDISIEAGNEVEGKLDAEGSWDGSLTIEFTDNSYTTKKTDAAKLGEMHYVKVSWTVGATALANKVNWYVDDCTVSDTTDANKKVDIIENQCFASVINAINESNNMLSTSDFKFEFKSFSFNAAGTGSQKISCNINFCLKETECAAETAKTGLNCDVNEAEKWVVPN